MASNRQIILHTECHIVQFPSPASHPRPGPIHLLQHLKPSSQTTSCGNPCWFYLERASQLHATWMGSHCQDPL